jgi:hypothetical protein
MMMFSIEPGERVIMGGEEEKAARRQRRQRARKFYRMDIDLRVGGVAGYVLQNADVLAPGVRVLLAPNNRGFPGYPEAPRFLFDKKQGRLPRDLEQYGDYWLVSDRLKSILEAVDAAGFAFVRCETVFRNGETGPLYWLCDVVRVLDAVDEERSQVRIGRQEKTGAKYYLLAGGADLIFKEDVIGDAHVFRLVPSTPTVICDQKVRDACKAAALKGPKFYDASSF